MIQKAAYFLNRDFLDVELGAHPSQIWKDLVEGRVFLAQGMIHRIGNGHNMHMWNNNWLLRDSSQRPLAYLSVDPPSMVSALIDEITASWRSDVNEGMFLPIDATIIKWILIFTSQTRTIGKGILRKMGCSLSDLPTEES